MSEAHLIEVFTSDKPITDISRAKSYTYQILTDKCIEVWVDDKLIWESP